MKNKPNILFLYSEIADYFISGCIELSNASHVSIVRWPVAKEAPFEIGNQQNVNIYDRKRYSDDSLRLLVESLNPNIIFCSGWLDKGYIKIIKEYSGRIPTVLTMDNHYTGSVKQIIAASLSKFLFFKYFSNAWVPGEPQFKYAAKLGFKAKSIQTGFYSANTSSFNSFYSANSEERKTNYPKRFFYLGRYVKHKGIFDLWDAFKSYRRNGGTWELICVGTGEEWDNRPEMVGLSHLGFKQPNEIPEILRQGGAYILPSHFEPWGVSVHEMAAAGLPLILSDKVGAASQFLESSKNGFRFSSGKIDELESALSRISHFEIPKLLEMGKRSHELAQTITPEKWAVNAMKFLVS